MCQLGPRMDLERSKKSGMRSRQPQEELQMTTATLLQVWCNGCSTKNLVAYKLFTNFHYRLSHGISKETILQPWHQEGTLR